VCTMGDKVNPYVARRWRPHRRSKRISVAYGPADATATLSLAPVNSDWFYLSDTGLPRQSQTQSTRAVK